MPCVKIMTDEKEQELREKLKDYFKSIEENLLPDTFNYEEQSKEIHVEGKSDKGITYGIWIQKK